MKVRRNKKFLNTWSLVFNVVSLHTINEPISTKDMQEGIKDIYTLLDEGRLKEALTQLQALATQTDNWDVRNRIEDALNAYGYLLQYAAQGTEDPARKDFYRKTLRNAYEMTDIVDIALQTRKTSSHYHDRIRIQSKYPAKPYLQLQMLLETFTEDIGTAPLIYHDRTRLKAETERIHKVHEETVTELFDRTWATPLWTETEAREATELLQSPLVPTNDTAVMVSAVTLALLRVFDERKLNFLMHAYRHEHQQVKQRALVGIAIILYKHTARIALYPKTTARLQLLAEEEAFRSNLFDIQMQLLITRETDKINKKMREEIMPEMIKGAKLQHPKFRFEETDDPEDRNPEWEKWIDENGIEEKIKQMGEWQMAGADVYMSSFAQLKHYPFFRQMHHWFYPFDLNLPILEPVRQQFEGPGISPLKYIAQSGYFCNSDKYSFSLAITSMPESMRQSAIDQMEQQANADPSTMDKLTALMAHTPKAKDISRQYIQDLYRFCKLWPGRKEEEDIFQWKFDLWNIPQLTHALDSLTKRKEMADYLMQNDYYDEAYELYMKLAASESATAEIYQKAGYIRQKQKQYREAIGHYRRADLIQPDNLWTNKHLAQCYRLEGDMETALEYYRKTETVQPDNLNIALQIGQCLARMERHSEALAYFYKVEYLEKNPDNARRAIAWCSFVSGKYQEALKYYTLLLEAEPKAQDWMNAGHVYLVLHQVPQAISHYKHAQEAEESHTAFVNKFNKDRLELKALGMSDEELNIVLDLLV